jgi:hypothetical protein
MNKRMILQFPVEAFGKLFAPLLFLNSAINLCSQNCSLRKPTHVDEGQIDEVVDRKVFQQNAGLPFVKYSSFIQFANARARDQFPGQAPSRGM